MEEVKRLCNYCKYKRNADSHGALECPMCGKTKVYEDYVRGDYHYEKTCYETNIDGECDNYEYDTTDDDIANIFFIIAVIASIILGICLTLGSLS